MEEDLEEMLHIHLIMLCYYRFLCDLKLLLNWISFHIITCTSRRFTLASPPSYTMCSGLPAELRHTIPVRVTQRQRLRKDATTKKTQPSSRMSQTQSFAFHVFISFSIKADRNNTNR